MMKAFKDSDLDEEFNKLYKEICNTEPLFNDENIHLLIDEVLNFELINHTNYNGASVYLLIDNEDFEEISKKFSDSFSENMSGDMLERFKEEYKILLFYRLFGTTLSEKVKEVLLNIFIFTDFNNIKSQSKFFENYEDKSNLPILRLEIEIDK